MVTSGAYTAPNYSFSGSFIVTGKSAGDVIEVAAVAVGTWGNGEPGGNVTHWIDLTVPECGTIGTGRFTGGGSQITVDGQPSTADKLAVGLSVKVQSTKSTDGTIVAKRIDAASTE